MSLIILSIDDGIAPLVLSPGSEAWARELISAQFLAAWPTESGGVAAYLEGETQPSADRFAQCSFQLLTSQQATQGQRPMIRYRGLAWIKLWTPATDEGRLRASELADAARRVFNRKQLSSSAYVAALQLETGNTPQRAVDGRWCLQGISFPCTWWEQTTS